MTDDTCPAPRARRETTKVPYAILRRWAACKNDAERLQVLAEVGAARHEIRCAYLPHAPELRRALADLEGRLQAIMCGDFSIAPASEPGGGGNCAGEWYTPRAAPLVGTAGYIAMLLAEQAARKARAHAELSGSLVHEQRWLLAAETQRVRYRIPTDGGATGWLAPVDPLSVRCIVCDAAVAVNCVQLLDEAQSG